MAFVVRSWLASLIPCDENELDLVDDSQNSGGERWLTYGRGSGQGATVTIATGVRQDRSDSTIEVAGSWPGGASTTWIHAGEVIET